MTENVNFYVFFDLLALSELGFARIFMHAIVNGVLPSQRSVAEWATDWHKFMLPLNGIAFYKK